MQAISASVKIGYPELIYMCDIRSQSVEDGADDFGVMLKAGMAEIVVDADGKKEESP